MLCPTHRITVRILAGRPRKRQGRWPPRSFILFLTRRQSEAGLLRDGGTTAAEVSHYVWELQREIEREVALRSRTGPKKSRRSPFGVAQSPKKLTARHPHYPTSEAILSSKKRVSAEKL